MLKWIDIFRKRAENADFSKQTIEAIFEFHETNPLAGLGSLSVRDRVIDDLIAQHTLVASKIKNVIPRAPAPVLKEALQPDAPLDLKAAQIAKKAGM